LQDTPPATPFANVGVTLSKLSGIAQNAIHRETLSVLSSLKRGLPAAPIRKA